QGRVPEVSVQGSGCGAGMDLGRMRGLAREAALVGAGAIMGAARPGQAAAKGLPGDWVTEVDLASERAIAAFLSEAEPGIAVSGEELGGESAGLRWVAGPLAGTTKPRQRFWAA